MSKSTMDDITSRKPTMIPHARNHVDASKDKPAVKVQREGVSHEEALKTEILVNQALIELLVFKGIISRDELLERMEEIRKLR